MKQQQEDMRNAEKAGLTTTKPETTFEEMLNAIEESLSNLASSDNWEDGKDNDGDEEDHELGKRSENNEPGWVMGTIYKTVQHRMGCFPQRQMRLDELTQPGWGDAPNYFNEIDQKYGTTELQEPAVGQLQTEHDTPSFALMTFCEPMETLDSVPGKSHMLHVPSLAGSSHMRLGSHIPQTQKCILSLPPNTAPNLSLINNSNPVEFESFYPCIQRPKLFTI